MDQGDPEKWTESFMEYASGHNSFNILFVVSFFASLAIVMVRFA
jgi:hypothetical protein